ncbi:probable cytochrome P450 6d4 isoform X2 [Bemisia tabaci]|uniref:probable cytochrome P450 6d4 isoform X2 n=1 Tax=Bemisia tabaci TaxID=7038 RepID=UPI003B27B794
MFLSLTLNLILCAAVLLWYFIYRYQKKYDYWRDLGVPFVGKSGDIIYETRKHKSFAIQDRYNELAPYSFGGIFQAAKPYLLVRDPELIQRILVRDFSHFTDRGIAFHEEIDPLNANLFNLGGQRWKKIRSKLVPIFSTGKLRSMFSKTEQCVLALNRYLSDKLKNSSEFEVRELMQKLTTQVIGTCVFGFDVDSISDEDTEFRKLERPLTPGPLKFRLRQILRSIHPRMLVWLRWKGFNKEVEDFVMNVTREAVKNGEVNRNKRNDLIQLMANLQHEERRELQDRTTETFADPLFTDHILAAQLFIFFLAGYDTTATTLANCLYELALNPGIMDRLRAEVQTICDANCGKLDYDALNRMPYMDCIINGNRFALMEIRAALAFFVNNFSLHPTSRTEVPLSINNNSILSLPARGVHLKIKKRKME